MSTKIPLIVPKRSMFNLSQGNTLTFGFGELIPTYTRDLLPGDHFKIKQSFNSRFLALLAPIMHRVRLCNSWFFVPYRLLWPNWEDFISPKDYLTTDGPAAPYVIIETDDPSYNFLNTYADYFDLISSRDGQAFAEKVSPMRLAAIRKIWNDFYRDQNLQEELEYQLVDGNNGNIGYDHPWVTPLARAYHSDYFTSALPWTQKGNPVFIPFAVTVDGSHVTIQNNQAFSPAASGTTVDSDGLTIRRTNTAMAYSSGAHLNDGRYELVMKSDITASESNIWSIIGLEASNGTATINDLRTALALQRWLERNARGGTRYVEYIFAHFGVVSPDARLQRAEFIGGNETVIQISEVLQTSATTDTSTPLGIPAGGAWSAGINSPIRYHAREHGMIICVTSLMFDNVYSSGADRDTFKFDRFDYFTPSFQNIGEQALLKRELGPTSDSEEVFGYIPRYEEYRVAHSRVHGDMRTSLDFWHLARGFDDAPSLNQAFIQSNNKTLTDRIFPYAQNEFPQYKQFLCQMYFDVKALRPIPKHGLPSIL